jgi:hypothetical protein
MRERFTRRRFLSAVGAGATYLALTNVVGCDLSERVPQAKTPKGGGPSTPKLSPLPNASLAPQKDGRAFRSRPDLSPPAVEVTTQAHDTPQLHLCRPGEWRRWAGRLDDRRRSRRGGVVSSPARQVRTRARPQSAELPRQVRAYLDGRVKRVRDLRPFLPRDSPPQRRQRL